MTASSTQNKCGSKNRRNMYNSDIEAMFGHVLDKLYQKIGWFITMRSYKCKNIFNV